MSRGHQAGKVMASGRAHWKGKPGTVGAPPRGTSSSGGDALMPRTSWLELLFTSISNLP